MPQEGKPDVSADATAPAGTEAQQPEEKQPANPSVEVSDSVKSYLKGLGLENAQATPELVKLAEVGMKQKESVSKKSLEVEQLLARLESQGKDTTIPETESQEAPKQEPEKTTPEPAPQATEAKIGVSDNDLFELARMISSDFKELVDGAQDGSIFRELRQLGYFTSKGINKKEIYEYLSKKNAAAQELRELREFKEKYEKPDPNAAPQYNAAPGINSDAKMDSQLAHAIVLSGDRENKRYNEALQFLRTEAAK